jgi:phospholipid/cholesterol/gamma-HCH transport system ATP-binding protein
MADERNDPSWGSGGHGDEGVRDQDEGVREHDEPSAEQATAEQDTHAESVHTDGTDESAHTDGERGEGADRQFAIPKALPGHREVQTGSPDGEADPPDTSDSGEEVPGNIHEQTREGEKPYQWHSGLKRDHGSTDAIEFIDVKKSFGRNTILNGLNLGIPDNQISMILGPSGTGKSVCIKHMVGLLYPDQGDVLVHGESVPNMVDDELFEMRKKFGVLFQDGALFGSMNVLDNVAFPIRQHTDKGEDEISDICQRRLREVGLSGAQDKFPNELSGGMRKRAGFARALVLDPDIVLFDEPDSGLDPVRTALLCELIQEVHAENGGAYVVITHDIMSARRVADYIAVLWKGRIVESGPASELFNSPNQFVRQFLSGEARGPLGME